MSLNMRPVKASPHHDPTGRYFGTQSWLFSSRSALCLSSRRLPANRRRFRATDGSYRRGQSNGDKAWHASGPKPFPLCLLDTTKGQHSGCDRPQEMQCSSGTAHATHTIGTGTVVAHGRRGALVSNRAALSLPPTVHRAGGRSRPAGAVCEGSGGVSSNTDTALGTGSTGGSSEMFMDEHPLSQFCTHGGRRQPMCDPEGCGGGCRGGGGTPHPPLG